MHKNFWTILTAGALLVILALYAVLFTVSAGTVKVVRTWGAISRVADRPGLYAKWPWPIQSVTEVDVRTRVLDVLGNELLTKDEFNVIAAVTVGWHISDPTKFWTTFQGSEKSAADNLRSRVADARKQVLNDTRLMDIVSTQPEQPKNYAALETNLRQTLQNGLPADYGLAVDSLLVKSLAFPADVTEKVGARMVKERERKSEEFKTQGENQAKQIKANAELKRQQILAEAEAEATRIRGEGDAAAAEHYRVFRENPELAGFLRRCAALRETLKKKTTVVLSTDEPPFNLLKATPPTIPAAPAPAAK